MNQTSKSSALVLNFLQQKENRKRMLHSIDKRDNEMLKKFQENRKRMKRK